jgi:hypothetical protein
VSALSKYVEVKCKVCGHNVPLPVVAARSDRDVVTFVGSPYVVQHICPGPKWVPIGMEDDTQAWVDPEWQKYEGDTE